MKENVEKAKCIFKGIFELLWVNLSMGKKKHQREKKKHSHLYWKCRGDVEYHERTETPFKFS